MKTLRCVVSLPNDNQYQKLQAMDAQSTAVGRGINVEILYAENDSVLQGRQLLNLIQSPAGKRPDAILVEPFSNTGLWQAARAAVDAGIGWVVLNFDDLDYVRALRKDGRAPVFAVTRNHNDIGRVQGQQFGALLPEGGTVLYIEGPPTSAAASQRSEGMNATKPANVRIQRLRSDSWSEEGGYQAVSSFINLPTSRTQRIDLIGCQYDGIALGARKAFQERTQGAERNRWLGLPYTGVDGLPTEGKAWVDRKIFAATVVALTTTSLGLEILSKSIQGGAQPPERTFVDISSYPSLNVLQAKDGRKQHELR